MRFCYADPPYPGQAKTRYKHDPRAAEVDPVALMARIHGEGYDGWALSTSSPTLRVLAPAMPKGARILAWVKPYAVFRPNVWPAYAWEPIILWGGRGDCGWNPKRQRPRDWVSCLPRLDGCKMGAKEPEFCFWLFDCWNARDGDELVDVFPGTGGVGAAWEFYRRALASGEPCGVPS